MVVKNQYWKLIVVRNQCREIIVVRELSLYVCKIYESVAARTHILYLGCRFCLVRPVVCDSKDSCLDRFDILLDNSGSLYK